MDPETEERLALIQAKIRRDEDISDDELRELILAAREGRRSAGGAQKAARKKIVEVPSIFQTFTQ